MAAAATTDRRWSAQPNTLALVPFQTGLFRTSTRSDHAVLCEAAPRRAPPHRDAAPPLPASPPSASGLQCSPGLLGSFPSRPSGPGLPAADAGPTAGARRGAAVYPPARSGQRERRARGTGLAQMPRRVAVVGAPAGCPDPRMRPPLIGHLAGRHLPSSPQMLRFRRHTCGCIRTVCQVGPQKQTR